MSLNFFDDVPSTATEPCARFLAGTAAIVELALFIASLVHHSDSAARTALEALAELDTRPGAEKWKQQLEEAPNKGPSERWFAKFARLIYKMQLTRTVDEYLGYVAGLLSAIFIARPEALRSSEKVDVEFVLQHETMTDLVGALAERRVERLAYAGLRDLAASVADRPGLDLFSSEANLLRGIRIVEDRNLIVHNYGIVNNVYRRKVPSTTRQVGQEVLLGYDEMMDDIAFLKAAVEETDRVAVAKWSLPVVPVVIAPFGPPEPE